MQLAIPSPDLILNLFASAGQVLGLLVVLLGGVAVARKKGPKGIAGARVASPWPFRVACAAFFACALGFTFFYLWTADRRNERLQTHLVRTSTAPGKEG